MGDILKQFVGVATARAAAAVATETGRLIAVHADARCSAMREALQAIVTHRGGASNAVARDMVEIARKALDADAMMPLPLPAPPSTPARPTDD